jgi:hypothetical protein
MDYHIVSIPVSDQQVEQQKVLLTDMLHRIGISSHDNYIEDKDCPYEVQLPFPLH